MKREYKPYIGEKFERSENRILIIVDEVKDLADFRKSKYDNYCRFLIEKNDDVKKILEQYDLKKNDVACYNYRYNCKDEIKLEKLKGKELTEYNNELKNRINQIKPWKIIIQREQITRNVAKRKKYFDSGKISFEKFLENKGIELIECRKDGKQDSSLIKEQLLELKSSLKKVDSFLKLLNPCEELFIKENYYRNYRCIIDELQNASSITNKLERNDKRSNTSSNEKNEAKKGKYLIVYTKDKKVVLDNIVDKYKEIYKLSETDFCFFSYIDKFDLLYELKEKNYQNLTERPLSWYNEKLVEFVVENKPSTIVFLGGQLSKTISKNKIPSINKKIKDFLKENDIFYFTEDLVTRESISTKKDRLFQIKSLMESLQDELCSKYHVSDSELERYHRYCKANDTLQKVIRKVNEALPTLPNNDELRKVRRMIPLLQDAFVPLPMFFELLDSFKDESDYIRIKSILSDITGMKAKVYNDEFREMHKEKLYDKGKINSYNRRLNHFYTRLKEGHYGYLEFMTNTIYMEYQIEKIKIYQNPTLISFKGEAFSIVKKRNKEIESDRQILKSLKKDSECANVYREKIKKNRSIIKKFGEEIAIRDGYRLEEKVRKYLLSRLWKPKNP